MPLGRGSNQEGAMPKVLERCVRKMKKKGASNSKAWGSCTKSTGWVRKKGGGWRKKKSKKK